MKDVLSGKIQQLNGSRIWYDSRIAVEIPIVALAKWKMLAKQGKRQISSH
jgi:hypothetical protein